MNVPQIPDRRIVITGANTGIGRETAIALAAAGARLTLAGRSLERTQPVLDAIASAGSPASFVPLDLADFASVRAAASTIAEAGPIDVLINNAGVAGLRGQTKDGFEMHFGINHLGHYLLTRLLAENIRAGDQPRVVTVASRASTRIGRFSLADVQAPTATRTGFPEYCHSKLANVLFSAELARREAAHGVHTYSLHPGVVATDIWRNLPGPIAAVVKRFFMIDSEEGAQTTLYCTTSPACAAESGLYYSDEKVKAPNPLAEDASLAEELWERSAQWVGLAP